MNKAPVIETWSKFGQARGMGEIIKAAIPFISQLLLFAFRFLTSTLLLVATVIVGGVIGYFCFFGASNGTARLVQSLVIDPPEVDLIKRTLMTGFGGSVVLPIIFLLRKRLPDFVSAFRAAWRWIWMGSIDESKGLIASLTRQVAVFAGFFFAWFSIIKAEPIHEVETRIPNETAVLESIGELRTQLVELKARMDSRNDFVVYVDKTNASNNPGETPPSGKAAQEKADLIYVALFENASFNEGNSKGRELDSREKARLQKFARSLRQISTSAKGLNLKIYGFASDAPKTENQTSGFKIADQLNQKLANERANYVYEIVRDALGDAKAKVTLEPPVPWTDINKMRKERRYNDMPVHFNEHDTSALAEAPNRRVEISVRLPAGLCYAASNGELAQTNGSMTGEK